MVVFEKILSVILIDIFTEEIPRIYFRITSEWEEFGVRGYLSNTIGCK